MTPLAASGQADAGAWAPREAPEARASAVALGGMAGLGVRLVG